MLSVSAMAIALAQNVVVPHFSAQPEADVVVLSENWAGSEQNVSIMV